MSVYSQTNWSRPAWAQFSWQPVPPYIVKRTCDLAETREDVSRVMIRRQGYAGNVEIALPVRQKLSEELQWFGFARAENRFNEMRK
jgi:hypothetical protein